MQKNEKDVVVADLSDKIAGTAFFLTDFTGMSVKQVTEFRRRLRTEGVEYVVVKNTLAQRALSGMEVPELAQFFAGPTGLVIDRSGGVSAAKVLTTFAREFDNKPKVKVGVVERRELPADQLQRLADLPPREVLLAQFAGGLQAPMARIAGGMNQLLAGFARLIDALRQEREGGAPAPAGDAA